MSAPLPRNTSAPHDVDAIVVGAGLAGLVATHELVLAGRRVLLLDQENQANLGGQAFWSLGGLFLVDSPEQRRMGVHDSEDLARQDWEGSAAFGDSDEDVWGRRWARAYVRFAATEKRDYLRALGLRLLPLVGWAERGDGRADGHGNSVPRFHLTWGTGPEVVRIFAEPVLRAVERGQVRLAFRHRVDRLLTEDDGRVVGVAGTLLEDSGEARGVSSSREAVGEFTERASAVLVTSGGIGHDAAAMRRLWPTTRLGPAPERLLMGVPAHVDGRMLDITADAGGRLVNRDRLWAYTEGIRNWDPIWPDHGIRILPGPSSLWFDAEGHRLPPPHYPGFDTLGTLRHILGTGYDHSWLVLTRSIIEREFALSGSEQNPDITGKDLRVLVRTRLASGVPDPVQAFLDHGEDFVTAHSVSDLVAGMNALGRGGHIDADHLHRQIVQRDRELDNPFGKDLQLMATANARRSRTDRFVRVAAPHRILDPDHGPLIAVRLTVLSRKTLGGLQTDLDSRVLGPDGTVVPGLFAAGEAAGFGGGGLHGHNALEGTFLGGCIFSGRAAGRAAAQG